MTDTLSEQRIAIICHQKNKREIIKEKGHSMTSVCDLQRIICQHKSDTASLVYCTCTIGIVWWPPGDNITKSKQLRDSKMPLWFPGAK